MFSQKKKLYRRVNIKSLIFVPYRGGVRTFFNAASCLKLSTDPYAGSQKLVAINFVYFHVAPVSQPPQHGDHRAAARVISLFGCLSFSLSPLILLPKLSLSVSP